MSKMKHNQTGAASLITVIFISLILMIVTVSFIRLAVREQRTSSDNDLTNRAFFTAEAGLEDAKQGIKNYLEDDSYALNADTCDPAQGFTGQLSTGVEFDTEYTCQLIDLTPASYVAQLDVNETVQTAINPVNEGGNPFNFDKIRIRWHALDSSLDGVPASLRTSTDLPEVSDWNNPSNDYPAMLIVQFFSHPKSSSFTTTDLGEDDNYIAYLNPYNGGTDAGDYDTQAGDGEILNANCDTGGVGSQYACEITITGFDGNSIQNYMRITSLYTGTNVSVELFTDSDAQRYFGDSQAVVDVTARAGDVYRRVQTVLSLSELNVLPSPSTAITSGADICKNFLVTNDPDDFNGVSGTSCAP